MIINTKNENSNFHSNSTRANKNNVIDTITICKVPENVEIQLVLIILLFEELYFVNAFPLGRFFLE
jgi:hypothetical protein